LALGLGYRQISVPVSVLPLARAVVRNVDLEIAAEVARDALQCTSTDEVREMVVERLDPHLGALWKEQGIV
jgi:phosphoenolpyruvate-protein kinase (PTS system EI component)